MATSLTSLIAITGQQQAFVVVATQLTTFHPSHSVLCPAHHLYRQWHRSVAYSPSYLHLELGTPQVHLVYGPAMAATPRKLRSQGPAEAIDIDHPHGEADHEDGMFDLEYQVGLALGLRIWRYSAWVEG